MENVMSPFEMGLVAIFHDAKSINESRIALIKLDVLERKAETIQESDDIKICMDFLFVRSNIQIARKRMEINHIKGVNNKLENLRVVVHKEKSE